jgi:hypothetical protein
MLETHSAYIYCTSQFDGDVQMQVDAHAGAGGAGGTGDGAHGSDDVEMMPVHVVS